MGLLQTSWPVLQNADPLVNVGIKDNGQLQLTLFGIKYSWDFIGPKTTDNLN